LNFDISTGFKATLAWLAAAAHGAHACGPFSVTANGSKLVRTTGFCTGAGAGAAGVVLPQPHGWLFPHGWLHDEQLLVVCPYGERAFLNAANRGRSEEPDAHALHELDEEHVEHVCGWQGATFSDDVHAEQVEQAGFAAHGAACWHWLFEEQQDCCCIDSHPRPHSESTSVSPPQFLGFNMARRSVIRDPEPLGDTCAKDARFAPLYFCIGWGELRTCEMLREGGELRENRDCAPKVKVRRIANARPECFN
jgi:hypothetical protein